MKILRTMICAALLVAGLCGCEKNLIPEINLADNLEGSWEKVYPEGVQDAGLVIWTFSSINKESQSPFILTIYVSDVFSGNSEEKYIYQEHQNGYPGVGSSTPEIYLFELDHDFMQEDRKAAYTPAARYYDVPEDGALYEVDPSASAQDGSYQVWPGMTEKLPLSRVEVAAVSVFCRSL